MAVNKENCKSSWSSCEKIRHIFDVLRAIVAQPSFVIYNIFKKRGIFTNPSFSFGRILKWLRLVYPTSFTLPTPRITERDPVSAASPDAREVWDLSASTESTWRDSASVSALTILDSPSTVKCSYRKKIKWWEFEVWIYFIIFKLISVISCQSVLF